MPSPDYAILMRKKSQFEALPEIDNSHRCRVLPICELPAPAFRKNKKPLPLGKQVREFGENISSHWQGNDRPILVDLAHGLIEPPSKGESSIRIFDQSLKLLRTPWAPVLTLKMRNEELQAAKKFAESGGEIAVKYELDSQLSAQSLIDRQSRLLGIEPERLHLIIVAGRVPEDADRRDAFQMRIATEISSLKNAERLKSVIVIGGSCPRSNAEFDQNALSSSKRLETLLFSFLHDRHKTLPCRAIIGDYGPVAPEPPSGGGGMGAPITPAVRYTTRDHWLISRGIPAAPRTAPTPEDYAFAAERIVWHDQFRSEASLGDDFFVQVVERNADRVNAPAFVREATVSHITFMINENRRKAAA